jgi:8-oxo-dGTP pyrophosphatase MutT (NUDIX family)
MIQRLKQTLSQRQKRRLVDARMKPSAVLVPIYFKNGEYHILFIKRTERVPTHKGQISFPGGACEPEDGSRCDTALRESTEEIGLPADCVEILGELDDFFTVSSSYIISPFVGLIPWPCSLKVDEGETEDIIEAPLSVLMDEPCLRKQTRLENGAEVITYSYEYGGAVIWGATAQILNQFLGIWMQVAKDSKDLG